MSELILAVIAIVVLPGLVGSLLPADKVALPQRWLAGLLGIGLLISFAYGWGVNQFIAYGLVGILAFVGAVNLLRQRLPLPKVSIYLLLVVLIILFLALVSWTDVINLPMNGGDALNIWFNKARYLYLWLPFKNIPINTYPNMGASLWAYVMSLSAFKEFLGRLLFPTAYLFWVLNLLKTKIRDPLGQGIFLIGIASVSIVVFNSEFWNGYQDYLLGIVAVSGAYLLAKVILSGKARNKWDFILGVFFVSCLYLIKNEGMFLAAIIMVSFLISLLLVWRPRKLLNIISGQRKVAATGLVLLGLPAVLWVLTLVHAGLNPGEVQGNAFSISGVLHIPQNLNRIRPIAHYLKENTLRILPLILLALFVTIIIVLVKRSKTLIATNIFLWLVVILHVVFILTTFMATNADLAWHLGTAFNRLMSQHVLMYVAIIAVNLSVILGEDFYSARTKARTVFARLFPEK